MSWRSGAKLNLRLVNYRRRPPAFISLSHCHYTHNSPRKPARIMRWISAWVITITEVASTTGSDNWRGVGFVVTEFKQDLRLKCRNPRCRMKLPAPVSNPREAFCTRGCHTAFYRSRCLVCEEPIERSRDDQKICRKANCRSAWRARTGFGRYIASSAAKLPSKKARL